MKRDHFLCFQKTLPLLLLALLFSLSCVFSEAQTSLQKNQIDTLIRQAESLRDKDALKSKILTEEAYQKSVKLQYDLGIAFALKNRATLYLFESNAKLAIQNYREAIVFFEKENYFRGMSDCTSNIALCYSQNSKFDSAMIYYQKNLAMEQWMDNKVGIAQTYENMGILYYYQGYSRKALDHFLKAATTFYKAGNFKLLNTTIVSISSIISDLGYDEVSIRLHNTALFLAKHFENIRLMGKCYNNIGFSYYNIGEYCKALEYLTYALEIKEQLNERESIMITMGVIGGVYKAQQRFDLSNQMYTNVIKIAEELDDQRQTGIGLTYIGENLRLQGQYQKAINYYLRSIEVLLPMGALNELQENEQLLTIAYYQLGDYKSSEKHHQEYLRYEKESESMY